MPRHNKLAKAKQGPPTQNYLDIAEIRDDSVVMKDGGMRAVLLCSSVNFSLKSDDEQNATIQAYVSFLNSLEWPIQIVIQSRQLNIDGYIDNLQVVLKSQTNELLRVMTEDYVNYVKELVTLGDIMTKRFYVVIPYTLLQDKKKSFWTKLRSAFKLGQSIKLGRETFNKYKEALDGRVDFVVSGLASMSVRAVRLDTQGLIELYYNTYNPEMQKNEKLGDIGKMNVEV